MGSSREYWRYAKDCARWAAEAKRREDQDVLLEMAKAWTNIALVETDVTRQAAREEFGWAGSNHTQLAPELMQIDTTASDNLPGFRELGATIPRR